MRTKFTVSGFIVALLMLSCSFAWADDPAANEDQPATTASDDGASSEPPAEATTEESKPAEESEPAEEPPTPEPPAIEPPETEPTKPEPSPTELTEPPAPEAPETEPTAPEPSAPEPSAPEPSAPEPSAPEPPKADTAAAKAFADLHRQWKDLNKKLDELRNEYQFAENDEKFEIYEEYTRLTDQVTELIPKLRSAAIDYYREQPNADISAVKLLIGMMVYYARQGDAPAAFEVGELLTKHKCDEKYFKTIERATNTGLEGSHILEEIALRYEEAMAGNLPRVGLETTKGEIVIELFENQAPNTVNNFVYLVEKGFYDGLTFHRVLRIPSEEGGKPFVAQAGCPKGDGTDGPGYTIECECYEPNARRHFTGSVAMARGPSHGSAGSQFYIAYSRLSELDGKYTVFGRVISGMDVVNQLQHRNPDEEGELPEPDKIVNAEVIRKRDHEYVPEEVVEMNKKEAEKEAEADEKTGSSTDAEKKSGNGAAPKKQD